MGLIQNRNFQLLPGFLMHSHIVLKQLSKHLISQVHVCYILWIHPLSVTRSAILSPLQYNTCELQCQAYRLKWMQAKSHLNPQSIPS